MYPKKTIFLLLLFWSSCLSAQFSQLDSLKTQLNQTEDLAQKVNLLTAIGHEYFRINEDSMKVYALQAVRLGEQLPEQSPSYLEALVLEARTYHFTNRLDTAITIAKKGLAIADKEQLPIYQAKFRNRLGVSLTRQKNYAEAMSLMLEAIDIFEKENSLENLANAYNDLSMVYLLQNERENGIRYMRRSAEIWDQLQPKETTRHALAYLNLAYATDGDSMSYPYALKGLELAEQSGKPGILSQAYMEMGYQNESAGNLEEAMAYYRKNLEIVKGMNSPSGLADAYRFLGNGYVSQGNYAKAEEELNKALKIYKAQHADLFTALTQDQLTIAYENTGQYEKALQAAKATIVFRDSLFDAEKLSISSELEAQYENQKKEAELAQQQLELEKQKSQKNKLLMGALVLFLLGLVIVQVLMARRKRTQKEIELALSIQQAEAAKLKELDQIKSNFFANISHEFRTPLTLIISPLKEMVRGDFKGNIETYHRLMLRNGERLLQLINQLLDLSKLESKEMKLDRVLLDMNQLVRQTAGNFESLAERKQITYLIKAGQKPMPVMLDRDKTEKILYNLLSNAFKFTKEEGRVEVHLQQEGERAVLKVADSGIGIAAADLPHVFDRFFQSHHGSSGSFDGSGIGLALTKELVEIQNGQIEVSSKENEGTVFLVSWPLEKKAVPVIQKKDTGTKHPKLETVMELAPFTSASKPGAALSGPDKILLVEDNVDVRFYLREKLEEHFDVIEAVDGREGLQLAIETVPDLIITDIMMPQMNGNELAAQLRRHIQTSHIPIIMLTARGDMDSKLDGLETGADDYLTKPVDNRELITRVNNLIAQRQQLKEKYARQIVFSNQQEESEEEALSQDDRFMRDVMQILEARLEDEEFGVEQLAQALHLSRYQLLRKIKALTGKSVSVFIRWVRLNRAKELLEKGQGNVSEIAFRMGFNSVAYFSSCFKEEFGISPSQV